LNNASPHLQDRCFSQVNNKARKNISASGIGRAVNAIFYYHDLQGLFEKWDLCHSCSLRNRILTKRQETNLAQLQYIGLLTIIINLKCFKLRLASDHSVMIS